jgi:hypothetical protein
MQCLACLACTLASTIHSLLTLASSDLLFVVFSQLDLRENKIGRWGVKPLAAALCINTSVMQVNLDGYSLPIKQLKGTEIVESIDLSQKGLKIASVVVIASLIQGNGSLRRLDVGSNNLSAESKDLLREAVELRKWEVQQGYTKSRSGIELKL